MTIETDRPRAGTHDAQQYRELGYVVRPGLVPELLCGYLASYLDLSAESGRLRPDSSVDRSWSVYGDPAFEVLLDAVTDTVADHVGASVRPTYSFARLYLGGAELSRHTDRPSCEHSISLLLGADSDEPWPLELADLQGRHVQVSQQPGDALCYQGTRVPHWREPFPGRWHGQVFLHFVERDGRFAAHALDRRVGLAHPPVGQAPPGDPLEVR